MTASRIAVLAVDLDGTALTSGGTLSARVATALNEATSAGLRIWFVSARPVWSIRALTATVREPDLAIGAAGAVAVDRRDRILFRRPLSAAAVESILDTTKARGGAALVYRDDEVAVTGSHPQVDLELELTARHPPHPENGAPADKILVFTGEASALERDLESSDDHQLARSSPTLLEVTAPQVDKGSALAAAAENEGIGRDAIAAVGDSATDLSMLRWVGLPIAVANAVSSVLEVASAHVPTNDQDGVAVWIDSWIRRRPTHSRPGMSSTPEEPT